MDTADLINQLELGITEARAELREDPSQADRLIPWIEKAQEDYADLAESYDEEQQSA